MSELTHTQGWAAIQADSRARLRSSLIATLVTSVAIGAAFIYAGAFDLRRYADAIPTILTLLGDSLPPDLSRWHKWGRPLLETLSMSVAGTVLGALAALPLGALAARNIVRSEWIGGPVRLLLNLLRSIPGLIWG